MSDPIKRAQRVRETLTATVQVKVTELLQSCARFTTGDDTPAPASASVSVRGARVTDPSVV